MIAITTSTRPAAIASRIRLRELIGGRRAPVAELSRSAPGRVAAVRGRLSRLLLLLASASVALLASAPGALAADGIGIGGPTDDRKVTYWAFGVMVFFTVRVIVASLIQIRLESRKERLRREFERVHRPTR